MAEEPRPRKSIHELRQEIAHSRDRLARDLSGLRYELDLPLKFRKSVQRHTSGWVAGAALAGVTMMMLPARQKKVYVKTKSGKKGDAPKGLLEAGFAIGALKLVGTLARPIVMKFLSRKISGYSGRSRPV